MPPIVPFHISLEGSVAPLKKQWLNPTFVLEDGIPILKIPRTYKHEGTKLGPSSSQTILGGPSVTGKGKALVLRRQHSGGSPSLKHQVHGTSVIAGCQGCRAVQAKLLPFFLLRLASTLAWQPGISSQDNFLQLEH